MEPNAVGVVFQIRRTGDLLVSRAHPCSLGLMAIKKGMHRAATQFYLF